MTLTTHHLPITFTVAEGGLGHAMARLLRLYPRWASARLNRALAAELTDEQLADAGLRRAALDGNIPAIEVSVSLMAGLMSMR